ncbi:MAG: DNA translocase FtsK [Candidatus Cellulosilyticum pullistercoris]|uniref:DNA translocase FtsK n=1 Tax=Candidatus Cellulosilyticum pullistercoris TaxID=2838521 RepID=A0A9E2NLI0_9FIRM|nr:DNA translocase FtsK [Candidatus Cellulosilyticum pullistercoris]
MNKGEGKKKGVTKKRTRIAKKSQTISSSVSKEIIGLSMIGIGLLVTIGIFSVKSGLFGQLLKQVFVGLFGIGGYIVPFGAIILGIFYMQGSFDKFYRLLIYGLSFIFMLVVFFHLLSYGDDTSLSLLSLSYLESASWQNGGYIGAMIARVTLTLLGLYGSYILLVVLYGIWLLLLTQFPIFSWINEQIVNQIELYKHKKKLKVKPKRERKVKTIAQEALPILEEENLEREYQQAQEVAEAPIAFFDGTSQSYEDEDVLQLSKVNSSSEDVLTSVKSTHKMTHDEIVKEQPHISFETEGDVPVYKAPPVSLLKKVATQQDKEASKKSLSNARKLEETLGSFGVEAKVTQIHRGPSVTRYELQPKQGVKVSKIVNLADDIALNLAASNIRIEAPIPGKAAVGIEVANATSEIVYLRDVIDSDRFLAFPSKLAFALGKDIAGKPIIADIGKMPHILIAGATGSGKSVCINTLITSIIYKATPQEVKLIMIDPKVVELSIYNGIPHLLIPVVTDPKKAAGALFWAVNEMTRRYNLFAENNVRDMKGYNEKQELAGDRLPQIVIIIDELADLMMTGAKEVEDAICRLAQMARAAGIHLVIATQRPSVDVITGVIKANIPSRLAFAVSSGTDSRTILDMVGAEKLLGKGDMLFYPVGESKPIRIQGAFISDQEVESIVNTIKTDRVDYEKSVMETLENVAAPASTDDEEADELLEKAVEFAADKEKLSISMLQRYFRIGFNRAARLMDALEARGVVGPDEGSKPRKVL